MSTRGGFRGVRWLAAAAACAVIPTAAGAQLRQIELTPFVGAYLPATDVARASENIGGSAIDIKVKQKAAFVVGGSARSWLTGRWGIEGTAAYALSDAEVTAAAGGESGSASTNANVWLFNAKLLARLSRPASTTTIFVGAGPAVIHRSGEVYNDLEGVRLRNLTDVGGVLSAALSYPVVQNLALHVGGEAYLYGTRLEGQVIGEPGSYKFDSRFQSDFVLSAGLGFRW
ncbi:MAG TPA: hypothetical protein VFS05_13850 [Gemmatimonadaceae bacterium]|nr:hypothetical protein [Gemmatimonadaceae bacterium]